MSKRIVTFQRPRRESPTFWRETVQLSQTHKTFRTINKKNQTVYYQEIGR